MSQQSLARAFPDLTRFLRWWMGELKPLVPQRVVNLLMPTRPSLLLGVGEKSLTVTHWTSDKAERVGEIDLSLSNLEQQRQELKRILDSYKLRNAQVVLHLQPSEAIRWHLAFPRAAASDLPQAIAFQINQKTPFEATETCYDHHIVEQSSDGSQIWVEVALAPRQKVLSALAKARAWQVFPDRIDVSSDEDRQEEGSRSDADFNLMPQGHRKKAGRFAVRLNVVLAIGITGLLALSIVLPLLQQQGRLDRIEQQLGIARSEAAETLRLQSEIDELSRQRGFLFTMKQGRPLQVAVIEELTEVLPDHTFLSELRIKGADVTITGNSASASSLVGRLEASPLFKGPKFRSSITQDPRNGLERFSLSFKLALEAGTDVKP